MVTLSRGSKPSNPNMKLFLLQLVSQRATQEVAFKNLAGSLKMQRTKEFKLLRRRLQDFKKESASSWKS